MASRASTDGRQSSMLSAGASEFGAASHAVMISARNDALDARLSQQRAAAAAAEAATQYADASVLSRDASELGGSPAVTHYADASILADL